MKEESVNVKRTFRERLASGVDALVGIFSPQREYARRAFRQASQFLSYRGASRNRLYGDWFPGGKSADQDILPDLASLRERSRDLNRNDGTAAGVTRTMTTNIVATGIRPQSRVDVEFVEGLTPKQAGQFQRKAERVWAKWAPHADASDRMSIYEIQKLIIRQIIENGEVLVLRRMIDAPHRPYATAIEMIEADRLDTPSDLKAFEGRTIRRGVELGENGEPIAYWIRKSHPGDLRIRVGTSKADFNRIPARNRFGQKNIYHLYFIERPGQSRGVPFFAPVINRFKDLADYLEAEVVAARVAACFAAFITNTADPFGAAVGRATKTSAKSQRIEEIEPAMVEYLGPGQDIKTVNPMRQGNTFDTFVDRVLRMISSSLNLPYEIVAKDFSKTNYSSARAALLEARRFFREWQDWLSQKFCQPVYAGLIEEAFLGGDFLDIDVLNFMEHIFEYTRARWVAPGWGWVDPTKEVKASVEAVNNNLSTLSDETAALGRDWEETLEQRQREEERRSELGVPSAADAVTGDPTEEGAPGGEAEPGAEPEPGEPQEPGAEEEGDDEPQRVVVSVAQSSKVTTRKRRRRARRDPRRSQSS